MHIEREFIRVLLYRTIGNFLILTSIVMIGKTFGPVAWQEAVYSYRQIRGVKTVVAQSVQEARRIQQTADNPTSPTAPLGARQQTNAFLALIDKFSGPAEEIMVPPDPNFSIIIPRIAASSKIIANVDSANYDEYIAALKQGVAHARGTSFPGDGGHIYLFAHSTDSIFNVGIYNAIFYLLYKLEANDEIDMFYQGHKYAYKIIDKKIVDPIDVSYMTRQSNKDFLTLQTCWPPGTTLKRLLIFAVPVVE